MGHFDTIHISVSQNCELYQKKKKQFNVKQLQFYIIHVPKKTFQNF